MMLVLRETRDSQFSTFCPPWRMMQEKALAWWHRSEGKRTMNEGNPVSEGNRKQSNNWNEVWMSVMVGLNSALLKVRIQADHSSLSPWLNWCGRKKIVRVEENLSVGQNLVKYIWGNLWTLRNRIKTSAPVFIKLGSSWCTLQWGVLHST